MVREASDASLRDTKQDREDIQNAGAKTTVEGMVGDIGKFAGILAAIPILGSLLGDVLGPVEEVLGGVEGEGGKLGTAFGAGYIGGYMLYQILSPLSQPLQHAVNAAVTNQIHDPDTAAMLVARGLMVPANGADEASGSGFDTDHFNRLVSLNESRPTIDQLTEMEHRNIISFDTFLTDAQRLGYNSENATHLWGISRQLLSAADLALAELRGFMQHSDALAYIKELGISPDDYQTLIDNTGEPPGTQDLLFAYRRGFIDKATLERGIRESRVRDEWIPTIERLRYSPMSVADAARATIQNYLPDTQAAEIAQQNGLEPDHWPFIRESYGRPLAHGEMTGLYNRGLASHEQVDQAFRESDQKDKYTDLSFELRRRLMQERYIVLAIQHNAITTQEGAKRLLQLGYDQADVNILLQLGLNEQKVTRHELTRAQIVTLYEDHVISKDDAITRLAALGYAKADAGYMIQIADIAVQAKEQRAELSVIRANYLAGAIDKDHAVSEMRQIGLPEGQANHNITVWDNEKRRAARTLTVAQIVKAGKEGTLTYDAALKLLVASGYSPGDSAIILQSNGATATTGTASQA